MSAAANIPSALRTPHPALPAERRIDIHTHLAGVGTGGSGCWIAGKLRRRITFRLLQRLNRVTEHQLRTTFDADWAAGLARLVDGSELNFAVALGFDGVYDDAGDLDLGRSQMIVPPDWVFRVCERHPELLPGPSIHPLRRDALERLDEAVERGAVLIKWLPSAQAIDPADRRIRPFLQRLADAGLPLLVHAGTGEQTFRMITPRFHELSRLVPALETGVTVIAAHAAAPLHFSFESDARPQLREMIGRYRNLWVDNSGLANPARFRHLPTLAADGVFQERTLHGSDYPVPNNAIYYPRILGRTLVRIERERNRLQRDMMLKQALGFSRETFTRAAGVLPLRHA